MLTINRKPSYWRIEVDKDKINDYEKRIRKTSKSTAKCNVCGYHAEEMYLSNCLCWKCTSDLLMMASFQV